MHAIADSVDAGEPELEQRCAERTQSQALRGFSHANQACCRPLDLAPVRSREAAPVCLGSVHDCERRVGALLRLDSLHVRSSYEVGRAQRVRVEVSGPRLLAGLRAGARPGDPERSSSCELAQGRFGSGYALRRAGHDHDGGGLERARGLGERVEWRVGPEEGDPPAALAQREAEDDERQIVLFPRRTGQESAWPGALIPAAGEAEEPPSEEVAGEVLVGNRRLASLPAVAQLTQVRQDHIAEDRLQRQVRQQPVDCHVRGCLVETRSAPPASRRHPAREQGRHRGGAHLPRGSYARPVRLTALASGGRA